MNNQVLFVIQGVFIFFFIWWLLSKRGRLPKPTVLDLKPDLEIQKEIRIVEQQENKSDKPVIQAIAAKEDKVEKAKVLNVIFMFNGHCWDAYEVFGLPAGSSIEQVQIKFDELLVSSDEGQKQFLQLAYSSIQDKMKKSV